MIENAIKKLNDEYAAVDKPTEYHRLIVEHLTKRVAEDEGLAADVLRGGKTWNSCYQYIRDKAQKQAVNNCAVIEHTLVYEWAEDYYRAPDELKPASQPKKKPASKPKKQTTEQKPVDDDGQISLF